MSTEPELDPNAMRGHACDASRLLKALANEQRLLIVCLLASGEHSVTELNDRLDLSQSALSQHLAVLRAHQVISERREGRNVYYHLNNPELAHWLADGLNFVIPEAKESRKVRSAIKAAKELWLGDEEE